MPLSQYRNFNGLKNQECLNVFFQDGKFTLYAVKKGTPQFLIGPCDACVILKCIEDEKPKRLHVFDFSSELKIEAAPQGLSLLDRKKWLWQKKRVFYAQDRPFFFDIFNGQNSFISCTLKETLIQNFLKDLKPYKSKVHLVNAYLHLFWFAKRKMEVLFPTVTNPFLFIEMPKGGFISALFVRHKIVFVRFFEPPAPQEKFYMKNRAIDMVKHVQTFLPDQNSTLVFCAPFFEEKTLLEQSFPKAIFLDGSAFHGFFGNPYAYSLPLLYYEALIKTSFTKGRMHTSKNQRKEKSIFYILILILIVAFLKNAYMWKQEYTEKKTRETLYAQASAFLAEKRVESHKKLELFNTFIAEAKKTFAQKMRLQKLTIDAKCMLLDIIYFDTPIFDEEVWKDFCLIRHEANEITLEGPSMFQEGCHENH